MLKETATSSRGSRKTKVFLTMHFGRIPVTAYLMLWIEYAVPEIPLYDADVNNDEELVEYIKELSQNGGQEMYEEN